MPTDMEQALDRFRLGVSADGDQRMREEDALRFQVPEMAWPKDVKEQRKPQIVGGVAIPQRPMLSIPTLDQPIQMTLNAEKAAHLGIKIHPISDQAHPPARERGLGPLCAGIRLVGRTVGLLDSRYALGHVYSALS